MKNIIKNLTIIILLLASYNIATALVPEQKFSNFAFSTLASSVTTNSSTITVNSATQFPNTGAFRILIYSSSCSNASSCIKKEFIDISSRSGNILTIGNRGNAVTETSYKTAQNWNTGDKVDHVISAGIIQILYDEFSSPTHSHDELQSRVTGTCGVDAISSIHSDGTVSCVVTTESIPTPIQDALDLKEDLINKSGDTNLGNSDTDYPTQNAVKTYVDYQVGTKQDILAYTPENVTSKSTNTNLGTSDIYYPSQNAVKGYVDTGLATKQNSLGYTAENVASKSTNTNLGTSDTYYPSQNAVKGYVDTGLATKQNSLTNPVTGPGSGATSGHVAVMNNSSGTSIADSGYSLSEYLLTTGTITEGQVTNLTSNLASKVSITSGTIDSPTISTGAVLSWITGTNQCLHVDAAGNIAGMGADCGTGGGGGGDVASVFSRTGAVTAQSGDYSFSQIGSKPTTLTGYGITDALNTSYTGSTGITILGTISTGTIPWNNINATPTTLTGYGITDALSSSWTPTWNQISNKPTTLTGYGITDALSSLWTPTWNQIGNKPTTLTGYGITDNLVYSFNTRTGAVTPQSSDYSSYYLASSWTPTWNQIGNKPTTLSGYGITDALASSYTGSTGIITVGTIGSGIWHGAAITDTYISSASTWSAKQPAGNYITGLTGDITATGPGSVSSTIGAGTVSLSKMSNLSANSIIGNNTGSSATPLALSVSQVRTLLTISNIDNTTDVNKPISLATQTALNLKEVLASKSTNTNLGTSDTYYPSQNAVKEYVDTGLSLKQDSLTAGVDYQTPLTVNVDYIGPTGNTSGSAGSLSSVNTISSGGTGTNFSGVVVGDIPIFTSSWPTPALGVISVPTSTECVLGKNVDGVWDCYTNIVSNAPIIVGTSSAPTSTGFMYLNSNTMAITAGTGTTARTLAYTDQISSGTTTLGTSTPTMGLAGILQSQGTGSNLSTVTIGSGLNLSNGTLSASTTTLGTSTPTTGLAGLLMSQASGSNLSVATIGNNLTLLNGTLSATTGTGTYSNIVTLSSGETWTISDFDGTKKKVLSAGTYTVPMNTANLSLHTYLSTTNIYVSLPTPTQQFIIQKDNDALVTYITGTGVEFTSTGWADLLSYNTGTWYIATNATFTWGNVTGGLWTCSDADVLCESFAAPGAGGNTDDDGDGNFDLAGWITSETTGTFTAGNGKIIHAVGSGGSSYAYYDTGAKIDSYVYLDNIKVTSESMGTNNFANLFRSCTINNGSTYAWTLSFQDAGSGNYLWYMSHYNGTAFTNDTATALLNTSYDIEIHYISSTSIEWWIDGVSQGIAYDIGTRQPRYWTIGEANFDAAVTYEINNIKIDDDTRPLMVGSD